MIMVILSVSWPNIFSISALGFSIVLVILCLLIVFLYLLGWIIGNRNKKTKEEEVTDVIMSAEESAAIAMAIHLYYAGVHDEESNIITIRNINNRYSPWSSKIYGIQ